MNCRTNLIAAVLLALAAAGPSFADLVWVNEFHYDNTGADAGEFIEVVVAPTGPAVGLITISLYNGSGGAVYDTHALSTFVVGANVNGYQFYSKAIAGIQNGSPDGIAIDVSGALLSFLSYEGTFAGTAGPANGVNSTDIGIAQAGTEPLGSSLGLTGTGTSGAPNGGDFTWTAFVGGSATPATPGQLNFGQTIPAPGALALLAVAGFIGARRRHRA